MVPNSVLIGSPLDMSQESTDFTTSRSGRPVKKVDYADNQIPELDDSINIDACLTKEERLGYIHQQCIKLGFESVFDAVRWEVRHPSTKHNTTQNMRVFAQTGGLAEMIDEMRDIGSFNMRGRPPNATHQIPSHMSKDDVCGMSLQVYMSEWDALCQLNILQNNIKDWTPDMLETFDFHLIFCRMQESAPHLLLLLQSMGTANGHVESDPKHERYIVFALSVLANLRSSRNTLISGVLGLYLYASRVPKRVIGALNHLGVSVSYQTIRRLLSDIAEAQRKVIQRVASSGKAYQSSYDNLNLADKVRDPRLFNITTFLNWTSLFLLIPPAPRRPPLFSLSKDLRKEMVLTLTPFDFYPTQSDNSNMTKSFEHLIATALSSFAVSRGITIPKLGFTAPCILQLDPHSTPDILTLPTYDLDESQIAETIKILEELQGDVGMSVQQRKEALVLYKGDGLTVNNIRYSLHCISTNLIDRKAQIRRSESASDQNFQYIEAAAGLFHLSMAVLGVLFKTHYGTLDTDVASLLVWLDELQRDIPRMWNVQKQSVKDFHAAHDFFDTVLDAYIIAAMAAYQCPKADDIQSFATELPKLIEEELRTMITTVSAFLADFNKVGNMRSVEERDPVHENLILFLQHGLVWRNAILAMRQGDIGRVENSLTYFAIWFQGTGNHNYASETLRLIASIKKIWSPEFRKFWEENALVNLSGKKEGFIACDMLNEYVVREVKSMMPPNLTPAGDEFLRQTLSPVIMIFKNLRKRMSEQLGVYNEDFHSSRVNPWKDIEVIVNRLLQERVASMDVGRATGNYMQVADLFRNGMFELSKGAGIDKLKAKIMDERSAADYVERELEDGEDKEDHDKEDHDKDVDIFAGYLDDPDWAASTLD